MDCEVADDGTDCDYSVQQDYGSISNYSTLGKTTQWIARLRTMERTATTACNKTTAASATTARSERRQGRSTTTQLCPSHHCRSARRSWRRRQERVLEGRGAWPLRPITER